MTAQTTTGSKISPQDYVDILAFYAQQMHLMDALKIEEYAATFTPDAVVDHVHSGHRQQGHEEMLAFMRAALPRYRNVAVRHWFDHLLIQTVGGGWTVSYYSLVTRTDSSGNVSFEPTFTVQDELVRQQDGEILTKSRTIHQDRPEAPA